jgi:hypothetical protein
MVPIVCPLASGSRRRLPAAALAGALFAGLLGFDSRGIAATLSPGAVLAQQRLTAKELVALRPVGPNPFLSFLPAGATPDYSAWSRWLRLQAKGKRASLPPADPTRLIATGESEPNGTQATADPVAGFGSGAGDDPAADVTGALGAAAPPAIIGPFAEDDGAIPLASATGLTNGASVKASGAIGDGPHGSGGTGTGDFDFFSISGLSAGDQIVIDVDTPLPFGDLDPFVAVWNSAGNLLAFNDDDSVSYDSYLAFTVPAAGTYYVSIGAYLSPMPLDPFDPASGTGFASEGTYDVTLGVNALDADFFAIALEAGDVIAGNLVGALGSKVTLYDPGGGERIGSLQDVTFIEPGPFPGGGAAAFAYVVESTGSHAVRVNGPSGPYTLELRVFRPELERQLAGAVQTLFVDFDGATLDPTIFGGGPSSATLSPLSSFLAGWGLAPGDESDLIDGILAVIEENLSTDMRVLGLNGNFDVSNIPGDFDVVLLNSRDHADPFGDPHVSRLVIGGTIPELGISTIGIAQSIDPGNFATSETGVVLLDLLSGPAFDPNSLNQFGLAGTATKIDLVAAGLGNIAAHEAGHFFANFHTDQFDATSNVMDQGGNLPGTVGVGGDLTLGTIDDVDVDFGDDAYVPSEGFTGVENTLNAVAFGLSTGGPICPVLPIGSCRSALKTSLQIKDKSPDTGDLIVFRWTRGDSTTQAELGDPTTGATYRLCVYDATGLVRSATAPAGGLCAGQPCWRQLGSATTPTGFKYGDRELTPTGTQSVTLKSGTSPKPKAIWKAKGDALDDSSLGLVPPVIVEVGNSETSVCFGGTYGGTDVLLNDSLQFKAKTQ